jgi:hypothetical protein
MNLELILQIGYVNFFTTLLKKDLILCTLSKDLNNILMKALVVVLYGTNKVQNKKAL